MIDAAPTADLETGVAPHQSAAPGPRPRPYAPSWFNRLVDRLERLPVPYLVVCLAVAAIGVAASNAQNWFGGTVAFPNLTLEESYWGGLAGIPLALIPYLDRVARSSLATFLPALEGADVDLDAVVYELTVIPARPALAATALAVAATVSGYISNPVETGIAGLPPTVVVIEAIGQSFVLAQMALLVYHTFRQLRAVSRIHALAPRLSLFRPGPLYAFSRLTVRTSIAFVAIVSATVLVSFGNLSSYPAVITVPFLVGGISAAAAAFVVPLLGIHRRISAEKVDLEWQVGRRVEAAMIEIHRAADERDVSRADGLNKLLGSLIAEREMVARLPTWPWQPGTVGAFLTAILLPIGLFLVTRVLERLVQ